MGTGTELFFHAACWPLVAMRTEDQCSLQWVEVWLLVNVSFHEHKL